ncbi:MAG: arginine--tRNA ligase, partial [Oscillospiraceae bacterium]
MNEIKYLNPKANAMNEAKALLCNAAAKAFPDKEMPSFVIEIPADNKNGDIATNFALAAAERVGAAPGRLGTALGG